MLETLEKYVLMREKKDALYGMTSHTVTHSFNNWSMLDW
jgi:hypothetical protein